MKAYVVDAFTRNGQGGNAAGVVVLTETLATERMQRIATELGFSETAFIDVVSSREHRIRFFTPQKEVDLCGHATIASYALLGKLGKIGPGSYRMQTLAGTQAIEYEASGRVRMTQNLPKFGDTLSPEIVGPCLGLLQEQLGESCGLPIQIASTGLCKIFVPVQSLEALRSVQPDYDAIAEVSEAYGAIGMYAYSLETQHDGTAHCRNFAPVVGILEDSATGTSAAALGCVLHHHGVLPENQSQVLSFEQGYSIGQPAELIVYLDISDKVIVSVAVAGDASLRETVQL